MIKDKTSLGNIGGSWRVLVPADIFRDSAFPFEVDDVLEIEIVNNTLIVRKAEK